MAEFQVNAAILAVLLSPLILFLVFVNIVFLNPKNKRKLPPSPLKLPVIGNLHQLSSLPHRSLHSLALKHGPIMLLHFGRVPVLVVSSSDIAREIMQTHDLAFASRPTFKAYKKLLYDGKDVASAPYGDHWRKVKSILVLKLLSSKRVESSRSIREEETALFVKKLEESSGRAVDLTAMFDKFTNDGICRSAFGTKFGESDNGRKFMSLLPEFMELVSAIDIGEYIPLLSWISRVNGFDKRVDCMDKAMDEVFEGIFQELLQNEKEDKNGDSSSFVDVLLDIYKGEAAQDDAIASSSLDRDTIKALIMDAYIGGTDTVSTAMEWAMTELLRHPAVMEELQREVRGIVKQKRDITDDDLEKMLYLKTVIKETLRCHPPVPLLVPRVARKDVEIKGYDVSAGTMVIINAWSMLRDPLYWDEPEKFIPERFLNSSRDFKGQDFEYIPFGSGRRKCPGITFAVASIEFMLVNLVQKFDWKLGGGIRGEDLDMKETPGLTAHRVVPLRAVASISSLA